MCGVCGIIAPFSSPEWRFETLSRLLLNSEHRGKDATGIAYVNTSGKLNVMKNGVAAREFVSEESFKKLKNSLPSIVMGHTRGASRNFSGNVGNPLGDPEKNENNHPFYSKYSGLAITHNGRIDDEMWRSTSGKDSGILYPPDGETDSEIFLRVLETIYLSDGGDFLANIEDTCFNIAGKYTIVILKANSPNKIWFIKNDNPLEFCYIPEQKAIIYASTETIIKNSISKEMWFQDFFWKETLPDVVINTIKDSHTLEIKLPSKNSKKFKFRQRGIESPSEDYKYHVILAEKEASEKEDCDEDEEREAIIMESD